MEIRIRVEGDHEGRALASLERWLAQDPDVARVAAIHLEPAASGPGDMGITVDAITAIVNDSIALGSLIVAYQAWRDSRSQRNEASIARGNVLVNLSGSSPETVHSVVEALTRPDGP